MRVLLLNPPADQGVRQVREGRCMQRAGAWTAIWTPISLAISASVLREKGFEVKLVDAIVEDYSLERIKQIVLDFQPRVVIINAVTPSIECDLSTCRTIKEVDNKISTAIIGIHGTSLPKECLTMQPSLDCVIRGEPELTTLELCQAIKNKTDLSNVLGLSYRDNDNLFHNSDREYINDLDVLPFPSWDLINLDKYRMPFTNERFLLVATSRGCPYQCTFCADKAYYGMKLRLRSPSKIVDELERNVSEFGIKEFLFWSESFTINIQFAQAVADEIIKRELDIKWVCNSRVDNVNIELLTKIKKAGCWMIGYGVESSSQKVLDSVKKGILVKDTINAVGLSKKAGLEVTAHCIIGFPEDTRETILDTVEFVKRLDIDYCQFYCAVPFPGSILYKEAKEKEWICSSDWRKFEQNFSVLNTPGLSAEEIMKLRSHAYKSFYLRPKKIIKIIKQTKTPAQFLNLMKGAIDFLGWI